MHILEIKLPDFVEVDSTELTLELAARLYEQKKLSLGQGAEMTGVSKRTFMELLGKHGISIFTTDADEISKDLKNA